MQLKTFFFNPIRECTYLFTSDSGETAIIDCGAYTSRERGRIEEYIREHQLQVTHHLLTHAHLDHVFGARFVYDTYGVLPHLHTADEPLFLHLREQAQMFGIPLSDTPLDQYHPLTDGDILRLGNTEIKVLHTPGHTEGGVCYYIESQHILFSGDTLFQGSIGRTDLPGGNYPTLLQSLDRIKLLPPETTVYPGHGLETSIGQEILYNQYLR